MKKYFFTLLLILCTWSGASTVQVQSPGSVVVWGYDGQGPTSAHSYLTCPASFSSLATGTDGGTTGSVVVARDTVLLQARPSGMN